MRYTINKIRPKRDGGGMLPLGTRAEVVAAFARMNTAPEAEGSRFLFGPGMRVELAMDPDSPNRASVLSAEVRVAEEELFAIIFQGTQQEYPGQLAKAIRRHGWHLLNLETGSCYPPMPIDDEE